MKQVLLFVIVLSAFAACKSKKAEEGQVSTKLAGASDTTASVSYAYKIKNPDQWEWGSKQNTQMVLQSLKDFENGNLDACISSFADSVLFVSDRFEKKMSKDELKKRFMEGQSANKKMEISMEDFESVKSKVDGSQYVSLWYKQKWQDQKGRWDSVYYMDDVKIDKGKIVLIDEKMRRFPEKKKS